MKKKVTEAGKLVALRKLNNWMKAIVNHLHHSISTTPYMSNLRQEKWLSLLNHNTRDDTCCEHGIIEEKHDDDDSFQIGYYQVSNREGTI